MNRLKVFGIVVFLLLYSINYGQTIISDEHLTTPVKNFLIGLNSSGITLESLPINEARKVLENVQSLYTYDYSSVEESSQIITIDSGHQVKLDIMRPKAERGILPAFIFIHGGGWVIGDYKTHKRLIRDIVLASGAVAVTVDYSRTPDAVFPIAINEVYSSSLWVFNHAAQLRIDSDKIGIVGNSAGGNMAAVTAMMAKELKGPDFKAVALMWPLLDSDFSTQSYIKYGKERYATTPLLEWMFDLYVTDKDQRNSIKISPLKATVEQLQGLPPTLIQVAENDVLRDEGEAYGRKLSKAGVKTVTVTYNGVIHDFGLLNALSEIPETKALIREIGSFLKANLK